MQQKHHFEKTFYEKNTLIHMVTFKRPCLFLHEGVPSGSECLNDSSGKPESLTAWFDI